MLTHSSKGSIIISNKIKMWFSDFASNNVWISKDNEEPSHWAYTMFYLVSIFRIHLVFTFKIISWSWTLNKISGRKLNIPFKWIQFPYTSISMFVRKVIDMRKVFRWHWFKVISDMKWARASHLSFPLWWL